MTTEQPEALRLAEELDDGYPPTALLMERAMGDTYKIKVIEADTGEVVKTLEAATERAAERIDRGLNINLNHADYYTMIEPPKKD